jgi:hypothetical protein
VGKASSDDRHLTHLYMCHAVVVQVGAGGEAFAAHLTLVGLLARMYPSVGVQRAGGAEAFAAHHANVGFFA